MLRLFLLLLSYVRSYCACEQQKLQAGQMRLNRVLVRVRSTPKKPFSEFCKVLVRARVVHFGKFRF